MTFSDSYHPAVCDPRPYPPVKAARKNICYADMIVPANPCHCWTGDACDYTKDMCRTFKGNSVAEEAAASFYLETASKIQDPFVCAVLNRIALDEKIHAKIFRHYLKMFSC